MIIRRHPRASVTVQLTAGFTRLDIGLDLRGLFIYNGFYLCMQCAHVPAPSTNYSRLIPAPIPVCKRTK